jgi:hypothetical protein
MRRSYWLKNWERSNDNGNGSVRVTGAFGLTHNISATRAIITAIHVLRAGRWNCVHGTGPAGESRCQLRENTLMARLIKIQWHAPTRWVSILQCDKLTWEGGHHEKRIGASEAQHPQRSRSAGG